MMNELNLKGNELLVYAIIYGFSQGGINEFSGSRKYLAEFTNSTVRTVQTSINSLVDKGFLLKTDQMINNIKYCRYIAVRCTGEKISPPSEKISPPSEKISPPSEKISPYGSEKISPNNITDIITNKKESKKETYDDILNNLITNDELKKALLEFIKMRKLIKKPLTNKALELNINKLKKFSSDVNEQIAIVNNTVEHSWQGFYPLDNKSSATTVQNKTPSQKVNRFNNFEQRQYSESELNELERRLLRR